MNPSRFARRLESAARISVAVTKALRSLRGLNRIADHALRNWRIECVERRVLLSAYSLSEVALFGINGSGAKPNSMMVVDSSGNLYGTTAQGGAYGLGTVFEIASGSQTATSLVSFTTANGSQPNGVALDPSGNLYGAMGEGGPNNDGTLFEIAKGSQAITTLAAFNGTNGDAPFSLVSDASSDLFGMTGSGGATNFGTVFELPAGSTTITTVLSFSYNIGFGPSGLTIDAAGNLYGTLTSGGTQSYGMVFEIPTGSSALTALASFNSSTGIVPVGGVAIGATGNLYGDANQGGANGFGTVYEIAAGSKTITALASFNGTNGYFPQAGVTLDASGNLFGTTEYGGATYTKDNNAGGTVFEVAAGSNAITTLTSFASGTNPMVGLTLGPDGNLYGTIPNGGAEDTGMMFQIADASDTVTSLVSFDQNDGINPQSPPTMDSAGNLFGTTLLGGAFNDGTIYEIPKGSSAVTVLAAFNGADGFEPAYGLTLDSAGDIFGIAQYGGASGSGTVFELAANSDTITALASFPLSDYPLGGITLDSSGDLFGTSERGGTYSMGRVFEIAAGTNTVTTYASFNGSDGSDPDSGVTFDRFGNIYGTTYYGGTSNEGTIFEIPTGSRTVTTLASFSSSVGVDPISRIEVDLSGDLYGTASYGGPSDYGTIFELPQGSNTITDISSLVPYGSEPSVLVSDAFGNLYGTLLNGGSGDGSVFEIGRNSSALTILASFDGGSGDQPSSGVFVDPAGNLYGTTNTGGSGNDGVLFKLAVNTTVTLLPVAGSSPSDVSHPLSFTANVSGGVPDWETVLLVDASNDNVVVAGGLLSGSSTTLTIPPGKLSVGTHDLVAVYGGDGNFSASESAPYAQTILPAITGISPFNGPAAGGTTVTITGSGFTGATAVDFGSTPATNFTVNSTGTQITAVDPAEAAGTTVDVTVVTPGGTSRTSSADQFTYTGTGLPSWLAAGSAATWNGLTSTLTITGSAKIISDPGSAEPNIVAKGSSANLAIAPTTDPSDIHIGGITLTDGASIVMADVDASQVADGTNAANHHNDHNVLVIGTLGAVNDPTISIDSASKLDLGDNDLIVHTGSSDTGTEDVQEFPETNELKAIEALAAEGRNVAPGGIFNGTWNGNGLTSSAAAIADSEVNAQYEQNILAVEQNSDMYLGGYSSWTVGSATEELGANDIIVKYTYNGDLNLDGAVDGNAATIFSTFYDNGATSGNTYAYGDLNGDGKINGNDATIFSTVYGNGLASSGLPQL